MLKKNDIVPSKQSKAISSLQLNSLDLLVLCLVWDVVCVLCCPVCGGIIYSWRPTVAD